MNITANLCKLTRTPTGGLDLGCEQAPIDVARRCLARSAECIGQRVQEGRVVNDHLKYLAEHYLELRK